MRVTTSQLVEKTGLSVSTIRNFLCIMEKYRILGNQRPMVYNIPDYEIYKFLVRAYYTIQHLRPHTRQRLKELIKLYRINEYEFLKNKQG